MENLGLPYSFLEIIAGRLNGDVVGFIRRATSLDSISFLTTSLCFAGILRRRKHTGGFSVS